MAEPHTADIVLPLAGRDKGQLMLVVAEEGISSCWQTGARGARRAPSASGAGMSAGRARAMSARGASCSRPAG